MAHIPYGYRIENGRASPDPEQKERLETFIKAYLGGHSFSESRIASGIGLSASSLRNYLKKGTYEGTDYYPAIVPAGTKEKLLERMEALSHPGFSRPVDPLPVFTTFKTGNPAGACPPGAAEAAEAIYSLIRPQEKGRTFMNTAEQAMVRAWCGIKKGG